MEDSENLGSSNEELLLQQEALILRYQQLERENAELKAASSSGPADAPTRERGGSLLEQLADGAIYAIQGAGEVLQDAGTAALEAGQSVLEPTEQDDVGILPDFSGFWEQVSFASRLKVFGA